MQLQSFYSMQDEERILEVLSLLSYRAGELDNYLRDIACGVSHLLELDWTVVTLCRNEQERVMASSLNLSEGDRVYSLHGTLTDTVVRTGQTLTVEDAKTHPEYGKPPEGYCSYLGVPLRTAQGEILGTLCSFCRQPRQFAVEEIRTAELFAERAATAIDNYHLYQQVRQFNQALEAEVAKRTEELKAAQAKLIEQERLAAIGEFAATIVHEIRNPVTTILMGLEYFKKTRLSQREQMRLSLALDEAKRLQNLLSEILLYAKPHVLQRETIDLNRFIEEMVVPLGEMPEAEGRRIDFIPSATPVNILGDKDKLKQVLINSVRNACEAIASGEAVICQVEADKNSSQAIISVCNGGTPIPAELLPKLTQPFCSGKPGGTGLGLAIVKRIVDAHGGTLSIQSDESLGTIVRIAIPFLE